MTAQRQATGEILATDLLTEARATHRAIGRTFWLASRLLPREIRDDVHLLYLVLRTLDDAVDLGRRDAVSTVEAVEQWTIDGTVASREARILDYLATRYPIEPSVIYDFCAGMRDDLSGTRIPTEADLDRYCYRVAGTVGLLMTALLGADDLDAARRPAVALGQAMQRTNILRDIDEDRAHGRLYLAAETIEHFGDPLPGRRAALMRDQIARADALYDEALAGIGDLRSGQLAITAAAGMYREILRELERGGLGVRPGRAVVPTHRKVRAAARARRTVAALS